MREALSCFLFYLVILLVILRLLLFQLLLRGVGWPRCLGEISIFLFPPWPYCSSVQVLFKDNVRIWTQCQTNHLSSYGTGFFKTVNAIDFEFIFADFDYADHVTIFIVLLVTIILFLITLIWSQIHDFM